MAVSTARTTGHDVPSGAVNRQRIMARTPTMGRPGSSPSTANQIGDGPNGFCSCFHRKNASSVRPPAQPRA